MRSRRISLVLAMWRTSLLILVLPSFAVSGAAKPLSPVEARKKVGEQITVEMKVRAAKDRLGIRGEIYLDSESNFPS
jgi:hypothetical protein